MIKRRKDKEMGEATRIVREAVETARIKELVMNGGFPPHKLA